MSRASAKLTGEDWVVKTQKAIRKAKLKDGLDPVENEPTTRENACHMAYNFLMNGAVYNPDSMDTVCGALAYAMGIEPPACAGAKNETLAAFVDEKLGGQKVDRVFMFNPDAVAQWVYLKYPTLFEKAEPYVGLHLPLCSVMPFLKIDPKLERKSRRNVLTSGAASAYMFKGAILSSESFTSFLKYASSSTISIFTCLPP